MSEPRTRRSFVVAGTSALAAATLGAGANPFARRRDFDVIIRGGTVFDGTGSEGRVLDVAIAGDRIMSLAPRIDAKGRDEIDARGLAP